MIAYLTERHPDEKHSIQKVELPVSGNLFPISAMPTGSPQGSYILCRKESCSVPVDVIGYYDLRDHEPLPDRKSDLKRRKAFARGTLVITPEGKIVSAADSKASRPSIKWVDKFCGASLMYTVL